MRLNYKEKSEQQSFFTIFFIVRQMSYNIFVQNHQNQYLCNIFPYDDKQRKEQCKNKNSTDRL